ncbi:single-stranded DNA-binding protein [Candidatus Izimaplasma bacterium ZiA1]|jgi:single-strand DNA-binding protein|uniref:single-stranded DNA-binding protein n=1 Tax=Candidatus Izimoplasma sp. ZiA1 TaxID=2024899 RepID=UPI000BAA3DC8|nr:single-stranded DNA-binding protein [Candidatus Izimaplasma bacterium ZiA1]
MINRVVLVGRLTKDPELRYTTSNLPVATFTIAVNRTFTNQSGEREADFIQCVVWRKQAENLQRFVKKGNLIGVEGRMQTRTYDDQAGVRKYITEVVCDSVQFLEPKNQDNQSDYQQYENTYPQKNNSYNNKRNDQTPTIDVSEDDLPF